MHRQFMRSGLPNSTTIVPVTVYSQGSYVATYRRSNPIELMDHDAPQRAHRIRIDVLPLGSRVAHGQHQRILSFDPRHGDRLDVGVKLAIQGTDELVCDHRIPGIGGMNSVEREHAS